MKILVTGYKGFIGSHMFLKLKENGYEVFGCQYEDFSPFLLKDKDWVVHCGGISSTTCNDVKEILAKNILFAEMLKKYCLVYGVNIQFSSSASVYGTRNTTFLESDPVDPCNLYAFSKAEGENIFLNNPIIDKTTQVFRYFNVYGDNEGCKTQPSPYFQFKKQAIEKGCITIFKNSEKYLRDFINVKKIVETQIKFLNIKESGLWNIGTGTPKSFRHVAEEIAGEFNASIKEVDMPESIAHSYQTFTCADTKKLNKTLMGIPNV